MRKTMIKVGAVVLAAIAVSAIPATVAAQSFIKTERVQFRKGATTAVVTRTIRGDETIDFVVNGMEGQQLKAMMTSKSRSAFFNIIEPGESDVAFYVGDTYPANRYTGRVPRSGDMKFRVYLNRAAARRGERATVRLTITISGRGAIVTQLPDRIPVGNGQVTQLPGDALVPGTSYNATGRVPCWTENGYVGTCFYGVRRQSGGNGTVTITKPNGRSRTVFYQRGNPTGYDFSQADPATFSWKRFGDEVSISIGQETYKIPDAVITGG
jgi:hypothetical protein